MKVRGLGCFIIGNFRPLFHSQCNGLLIGQAVREDWHAILGEPDETMTFTDSMAYDYGLPVGESDIYHFGEHELRLHADTDGVLRAVQLGK